MPALEWITPDWPAPPWVKAYTTTRCGGYSQAPYQGLNLALHVGDDPTTVQANRALLRQTLPLPAEPCWLHQTHSTEIIEAKAINKATCAADAVYTTTPDHVCVVLTADCLPVLFCDQAGKQVAAVHAGWRGLLQGILENTIQSLQTPGETLLAWLGPAIGPHAFEVGDEVYRAFITASPQAAAAFTIARSHHWYADLYQLARQRLIRQGITAIYGGTRCTFSEAKHFYSYRRDKVTGRMASLIWLIGDKTSK